MWSCTGLHRTATQVRAVWNIASIAFPHQSARHVLINVKHVKRELASVIFAASAAVMCIPAYAIWLLTPSKTNKSVDWHMERRTIKEKHKGVFNSRHSRKGNKVRLTHGLFLVVKRKIWSPRQSIKSGSELLWMTHKGLLYVDGLRFCVCCCFRQAPDA